MFCHPARLVEGTARRLIYSRPLGLLLTSLFIAWLIFGPLVPSPAYSQGQPLPQVFTYFYYWYEPPNGVPYVMQNNEMLTNHFPPTQPANWRSVGWFKGQFRDMQTAGIDVALTVYWGDSLYDSTGWSAAGLEPMVEALDELDQAGEPHPRLGLFFDTYVLDGAALTDPEKRTWFADQIRSYFKSVPDRYRARQDGRPIIWMYLSNFANSFDQRAFESLSADLAEDLGARPFWVAEVSWARPTITDEEGLRRPDRSRRIGFDAYYRWGAASRGMLFVDQPLPIAEIGPGYDDSAVYDRGDERSNRPREDGCFFARGWLKAQKEGARWIAIETWNENYEGSGIAETVEWGRTYLADSAIYSRAFKADQPIALPQRCADLPADDEPLAGPDDDWASIVPADPDLLGVAADPDAEVGDEAARPSGAQCPGRRRPRPADRPVPSLRLSHRCG